jgi:hypothetical protein
MELRLDTAFESWGEFAPPDQRETPIRGVLRFKPGEGMTLTLSEYPGDAFAALMGGTSAFPVVHGRLVDGTALTLFDSFVTGGSIYPGSRNGSPTTLHVNRALVGAHVADLGALRVNACEMELSSLAAWAGLQPPSLSRQTDPDGTERVACAGTLPDAICASLPTEGRTLTVRAGFSTQNTPTSLAVSCRAAVTLDALAGMTFDECLRLAFRAQTLFMLLIGGRLCVRAVTISTDTPPDPGAGAITLQYLYTQRSPSDSPDIPVPLMPLPYGAIRAEFPTMVRTWFAQSEQAFLAVDLFFGGTYLDRPIGPAHFLTVMQAAEAYHRSLGTGFYMDPAAYEAAIAPFIAGIPPVLDADHRKSLKARLTWGNEYSLRKRMTALVGRLPTAVHAWITGNDTQFVERVIATRNYYTHRDATAAADILTPEAAYWAAERVRILVVAHLLRGIGVPDAHLLAVLQRNQDFVRVVLH